MEKVLIAGRWREANALSSFQAANPANRELLEPQYPVSAWEDCDEALNAAVTASVALRDISGAQIADFLEAYADDIELNAEAIIDMAHAETAYPKETRLAGGEMPRTTNQLRQAAAAARDGSWALPTIDTAAGIRSVYGAIGPVCVFGPNNFPLAFGSASGGDFAAAIAAGNPVIAKANSSHPGTTRLFAECAQRAAEATAMPAGMVQLIYRTSHEDGERLVSDARTGATGYTGSRQAGLKLKQAADLTGKPIYLELSSVNPVAILPGALKEKGAEIAEEFTGSCLLGTGQFCTNPGLVLLLAGESTDRFIQAVTAKFAEAPVGTLLSAGVETSLASNLQVLVDTGAELLVGNTAVDEGRFCYANTLLQVTASQFLADPETMQTEAFGNSSLLLVAESVDELIQVVATLEGNLTGCIYSDTAGADDDAYDQIAGEMRVKVGRLLNDKMPTGVAVSAAMNHGGPFPATGHPAFTAVGIPGALLRFGMLQCYDNVRLHRLPCILKDESPNGTVWRNVDGVWTQANLG
ncbi:MAG: ketoglutarate semialdehyde dehydrogenase [Planctomycetaceae bacterium]|nr:ketoglutarate semialdehyde dehydrogenase [Planctomycetaceae bacterium]